MSSAGELRRLLAFGCVGACAFAMYLMLVATVVESGYHPVFGVSLGFIGGTAVSFWGNCRFVFKAPASLIVGRRFLATTVGGLILNVALGWVLTKAGVHYAAMTVIIFAVVPAFNYLGHRFWTFSEGPKGTIDG